MKFNWNLESHIDENGCPSIEMLLGNMNIEIKNLRIIMKLLREYGYRFKRNWIAN